MINEYWGEGQRDCTDVPSGVGVGHRSSGSFFGAGGLFSFFYNDVSAWFYAEAARDCLIFHTEQSSRLRLGWVSRMFVYLRTYLDGDDLSCIYSRAR